MNAVPTLEVLFVGIAFIQSVTIKFDCCAADAMNGIPTQAHCDSKGV
jgi:hypothetical protein